MQNGHEDADALLDVRCSKPRRGTLCNQRFFLYRRSDGTILVKCPRCNGVTEVPLLDAPG